MRYVEHRPPTSLAPGVECLWFLEADAPQGVAGIERIIPDGCAEIIVQYGDPFRTVGPDGAPGAMQPRAFLAGVLRRYWLVQPTGRVRTIGIRLRPGGVGALFEGAAQRVSDSATPLDALWGKLADELVDRLMTASDDEARIRIVARLLAPPARSPARRDSAIAAAVTAVMRSRGRARLSELAGACSLSPRQLQRRFQAAVGIGPKTLSRIARFQDLLRRLREGPAARWTDHALAAGFYDQAHLVRDFREFTGQSPSRFVADDGMLSRCFSSPERIAHLLDA